MISDFTYDLIAAYFFSFCQKYLYFMQKMKALIKMVFFFSTWIQSLTFYHLHLHSTTKKKERKKEARNFKHLFVVGS